MIQVLENPKTENYLALKKIILSNQFPWYFQDNSTYEKDGYDNIAFYGHIFLSRPETNRLRYAEMQSPYLDSVAEVLQEILLYNNIDAYTFLRINANMVMPTAIVKKTVPHHDHEYKHKNFLLYLTSSGGNTMVEEDKYSPQEDDAIVFDGLHYIETPTKDERRIVIIATFLDKTTNPPYE